MLISDRFEAGKSYPLHKDKLDRGWLVQKAYDRKVGCDVILKSVPADTERGVRELAQEDDMRRRLKRHGGRLDQNRALPITVHVLEAFEALNRAGVIHRDPHPKQISYRDRDRLNWLGFLPHLSVPLVTVSRENRAKTILFPAVS